MDEISIDLRNDVIGFFPLAGSCDGRPGAQKKSWGRLVKKSGEGVKKSGESRCQGGQKTQAHTNLKKKYFNHHHPIYKREHVRVLFYFQDKSRSKNKSKRRIKSKSKSKNKSKRRIKSKSWEQGAGSKEQGAGSKEQRARSRSKEQGARSSPPGGLETRDKNNDAPLPPKNSNASYTSGVLFSSHVSVTRRAVFF